MRWSLTHISENDWHYCLYKRIFRFSEPRKACSYWFMVLMSGLFLAIDLIGNILGKGLFAFFGFRMKPDGSFYDYKQRSDGTYSHFAPWQIILPFMVISLLYYTVFVNIPGGILLLFMLFAIFFPFIYDEYKARIDNSVFMNFLKRGMDASCPNLVIEPAHVREDQRT